MIVGDNKVGIPNFPINLKSVILQGRTISYKLSPNLRMRPRPEENALAEDDRKLFNFLNLIKLQKLLSSIVKLPDKINLPVTNKN